jgi:HK97 family phage major capsid protein
MTDESVSAEEFAQLRNKMNRAADRVDAIADSLANIRAPSKAHLIAAGNGGSYSDTEDGGRFIKAVMQARGNDAATQFEGKGELEALAARYVSDEQVGGWAKSTLGSTDATGGWIIPNAIVDGLAKPRAFSNVYRDLVTVRTGVNAPSVDLPFRSAMPARAVIAPFGQTKENLDLAYNGYTATMYTLARIYDLGRQFVRQSSGAAEQEVLSELGAALERGEAFYLREGTGSSQPFGFIPALTNGPSTYRTTFCPSATTLAGSIVAAIGNASADLMARGRRPEAAVISPDVFKLLTTQGTDTAGLFLSGSVGSPTLPNLPAGTLVTSFGVPIVVDIDFASDDLVVAEWSAVHLYIGTDARIDTSEVAGTRWDTNLVGFRGEEEMAADCRAAVYSGAMQMILDVTP